MLFQVGWGGGGGVGLLERLVMGGLDKVVWVWDMFL
jgi:hypothetical protein